MTEKNTTENVNATETPAAPDAAQVARVEEPKARPFDRKDMPSPEQQKLVETAVKKLLNPDGTNTQMDGYVTSTFSYISDMLNKMADSQNKDQTATEIAEDLKQRFEGWSNEQKAKRDQKRAEKAAAAAATPDK